MAREYLRKLAALVEELGIGEQTGRHVEVRHLFSGAALYVDVRICASWSPGGLAFKLSEQEATGLISTGHGKPLKYFPQGHVKKDYVLFNSPESDDPERWREYFMKAIRFSRT